MTRWRYCLRAFATLPAICIVGAVITPNSANAQVDATNLNSDTEAGPPAPSDRFDTVLTGFATSLDISEKEATTSFSVGGNLTTTTQDDSGKQTQDAFLWKFGGSFSFGGESDFFDDATLDFLSGGIKLSAGLTWKHFTSDPNYLVDGQFNSSLPRAVEKCRSVETPPSRCDVLANPPGIVAPGVVVQKYLPREFRRVRRKLAEPFYTVGLSFDLGINEFDFTLPGSFEDKSRTLVSPSAKLTGVYFPGDSLSAIKLEAEYSNAAKALDEEIVCKTVIVEPKDDCKKASPARPSRKEAVILRGEYRRFFPFGTDLQQGIGIAPLLSIDTLSGDFGAELPIFFQRGKKAPILPGIKIGYKKDAKKPNDKDESFTIALFLKTSFGF